VTSQKTVADGKTDRRWKHKSGQPGWWTTTLKLIHAELAVMGSVCFICVWFIYN
jgi:hypothetical protein